MFTRQFHFVFWLCALITFMPSLNYASSWPTFSWPDKDYLLSHRFIETNSCPQGQGRLLPNLRIDIQELCKTYCPQSWVWVAKLSDERCHDLSNYFNFQTHSINHYPNQDGTTNYSVITTSYGNKSSTTSGFKLEMATQPGEHWHCYAMHQAKPFFACANDT